MSYVSFPTTDTPTESRVMFLASRGHNDKRYAAHAARNLGFDVRDHPAATVAIDRMVGIVASMKFDQGVWRWTPSPKLIKMIGN